MMHPSSKYLFLVLFFIFLQSCKNEVKYVSFPATESEFAAPVVKKLSKPNIIKVTPVVIPLGKGSADSIKLPKAEALVKPKVTPFITNQKTLGKPQMVMGKAPDTLYYFSRLALSKLQKKHPGKHFIYVKPPLTKKIKPRLVMLGQPEKVIGGPAFSREQATSNIKIYTQQQGLAGMAVNCMSYDGKGNLWVGTDAGLCKFDGKEWWLYSTVQGLSGNTISSLTISRTGKILIGINGGGLNIVDLENNIVKHYSTKEGLSSNNIKSLVECRNGKLIIGSLGWGINILEQCNGDKYQRLTIYNKEQGLCGNYISSMVESRNGNIVIGTFDHGFSIFENLTSISDKIIVNYKKAQGLSSNNISSVMESREGHLLIATNGGGLNVLQTADGNGAYRIKIYGKAQGLSNNLNRLLESTEGNLLIGTFDLGLTIIKDYFNKAVQNYSMAYYGEAQGLNNNSVNSLLESKNGPLLIGTFGGGLNVLDIKANNFYFYTTQHGFANYNIFSITQGLSNELFFGSFGGGVNMLSFTKPFASDTALVLSHFGVEQGLNNNNVLILKQLKNGNLVVGTWGGGINILDLQNNTVKKYGMVQGLSINHIKCLVESRDGNLFIGTMGGGLNSIEQPNTTTQTIKHYPLAAALNSNYIMSLLLSHSGKLLIGTLGGGFYVLDTNLPGGPHMSQNFIHFGTEHGLSNNDIECFLESSDGKLLIGTNGGGLMVMEPEAYSGKITINQTIRIYGKAQGLVDNIVYAIKEDKLGNIWLGTGKGLTKLIKKNGLYVVAKSFDNTDGLKSLDFNQDAMYITKKGTMWAGIGNALTEFEPAAKTDTLRPKTYITCVEVMEKKEDWFTNKKIVEAALALPENRKDTIWLPGLDATYYTNGAVLTDTSYFAKNNIHYSGVSKDIFHLPKDLAIPFSQNHLTFHYTGICIAANSSKIRYRYILEGLDEKWSSITEKSEADYRNIPPGNYSFKVAARSIDGYWSTPVAFAFKVLPPWYQTYWAIAGYTISLIAFIFGFTQWRQRRLRKFSNLMIKAQEEEKLRISRDLHDDLGQELSFYRMNFVVQEEAKNAIDRIIEKVRTISYNLRPIKAIDADIKENLETLINSIKKDTIFFSYEIESILDLTQEEEINIYRITQEAINNIIKHSKANNARVTLTKHGKFVVLEILDDGMGFLINNKTKTVGLKSMKERANLINAKLNIAALEKGTKITLKLKHE
ncbi:MAG: two-component regulator propeller domain-containing protein [Bacteroidota bacterium]